MVRIGALLSLGKFFAQPQRRYTLAAPLDGVVLAKSALPDPVFSQGLLGPTIGFMPTQSGEHIVCAPCCGVVSQIFRSSHALTLQSVFGLELLIHIGINTVNLRGRGFELFVHEDQDVNTGDPLIKFDPEVIQAAGFSLELPMVVCNPERFSAVEFTAPGPIKRGEICCTLQH